MKYIGHTNITQNLLLFIQQKYTGVLNFIGPESCGKSLVASWFALKVAHKLDIKKLEVNNTTTKSDMTTFLSDQCYPAFNGENKVYIIDVQVKLKSTVSSILLKNLENLAKGQVVIFIIPNVDFTLKTLLSRSLVINFSKLSNDDALQVLKLNYSEEEANIYIKCLGSSLKYINKVNMKALKTKQEFIYTEFSKLNNKLFSTCHMISKELIKDLIIYQSILMQWLNYSMTQNEYNEPFIKLVMDLINLEESRNIQLKVDNVLYKYIGH